MTSSPIVREYCAEQGAPGLGRHLRGLLEYPRTMWRYRSLVRNFSRRELFGRFHGSYLGALWVLVHPVFLFAVYYLVFGILFARGGTQDETGSGGDPLFAFYLFSGIIVFTAFSEATAQCCNSVLNNGNLVKKVMFPCELLPVSTVLVSLVVYAIGAAVFLSIGIPYGAVQLDANFALWPVVIAVQGAMTLGFGLMLANLQVFMRDTSHLYGIVRTAWFFCSPIFWYVTLIETQLGQTVASLFKLNPMYGLIQAQRQTLGLGRFTSVIPEPLWQNLGAAALWAIVFMVVGYVSFLANKQKYADLV
jgi:lipopolysaccharide transport system permease protein